MSIFLRRWPDALWPSENSIESHMVSYCSVIKVCLSKLSVCVVVRVDKFGTLIHFVILYMDFFFNALIKMGEYSTFLYTIY